MNPEIAIDLTTETPDDGPVIDKLHERAFGPGRFTRTAFRLREGVPPHPDLSFVARIGSMIVGSIRLTPMHVGETSALLLGPLTVEPAFRSRGIGLTLMKVPGTILWPVSVAGGIGAMLGVTALFGWLRRSESGQTLGDGAWFGVEGTLVVPFDRATRLGRVSAVVGGQVHELTATWNEDEPLPDLPVGAPVLIDRLDRGIAVLTNLT